MPSLAKTLKKKVSKRFGRKKKSKDLASENKIRFPIFNLSDDLIIHVLSFLSSVPFESNDGEESLFSDFIARESIRIHRSFAASPFQPASLSLQIYQAASQKCEDELKVTLDTFGTLTHVLPFVCKKFRVLCQASDGLWNEATERLIVAHPQVWGDGIRQLCEGEIIDEKDICLYASKSCGSSRCAFQRIVEDHHQSQRESDAETEDV